MATAIGSFRESHDEVIHVDPAQMAHVLSPLGNEQRIRIIQSLLFGAKTAKELMVELALTSGQLYHHLRELAKGGYLAVTERNTYKLTSHMKPLCLLLLMWVKSNKRPDSAMVTEADFVETDTTPS